MQLGITLLRSIVKAVKTVSTQEGKEVLLKFNAKPAFKFKQLNSGNFASMGGRPCFTNLQSGTKTLYESNGNAVETTVLFGEGNKAASRLNLVGLTKRYNAQTGELIKTEYSFKSGVEKFGKTEIPKIETKALTAKAGKTQVREMFKKYIHKK